MPRTITSLVVAACILASCGGDDTGGARDASPDDAVVPDAPGDVMLVPMATGEIAECAGTGTGDRPCIIEVNLDPVRCANNGCASLAIYFAGGNQTCPTQIMADYVAAGYVAVCVLLFGDSAEAGNYAYADEAGRVDLSIRTITNDPLVTSAWNRSRLLITGSSHGATAPVIAMARTQLDALPGWRGNDLTAACFMDGIYDIAALDTLLGTGDAGQPCPPPPGGVLSHARAVGRYYSTDPVVHSCANSKCACAAGHSSQLDNDTITAVPASEFTITKWKLVECGSALAACTGDVVPAAPITTLCSTIDASPDHTCEMQSLPNTPHIACAPAAVCQTWFDAL